MKRPKFARPVITSLAIFFLGAFAIYNLPPVQERVGWRVAELMARVKYAISPPEESIFIPQEASILPTKTVSPTSPAPSAGNKITVTPPATPSALSTPTKAPAKTPQSINLAGFSHEYQTWNNCGPATLSMALSYWGWEGDQRPIAAFTKPNSRDKNVMPYEMTAYVEEETDLEIVYRVGGDVDLLKRFIASKLPVIIEKGFEGPDFDGWMGHYVLVTGYDDSEQRFILQDSYYGPDQVMGYEDLESYWRAFNFTYLVVFPDERRAEIESILGTHVDEDYNNRYAAQRASDDIFTLTGRDQFFAWFNRGTNLVRLQDYAGAAEAYDQAFALYPTIPEKERPWRMMWYQTGPYWAYYYTGRYQDVINLATTTLDAMSEPVLEESYYWRALAREALGDTEEAIKDLQSALKVHPGFEPAATKLEQMGVEP
ncbi:MAG: tetratricopeptide repeat protein [Chloroflexi bacterium]|nr:tetratricopeptide repeat protein [Chloroflexota bacterium]